MFYSQSQLSGVTAFPSHIGSPTARCLPSEAQVRLHVPGWLYRPDPDTPTY